MATLTLSSKDPAGIAADAVVVAVLSQDDGPRLIGDHLPAALRRRVRSAMGPLGVLGAVDEVTKIPTDGALAAPLLVLVGVGRLGTSGGTAPAGTRRPAAGVIGNETLRRAAGAAVRALAGSGSVAFDLPVPDVGAVAAVAEGALLGAYAFTRYRSDSTSAKALAKRPVRTVIVLTAEARTAAARAAAKRANVVADAVNGTRDLVNTPAADLYPSAFAELATSLAGQVGVGVTVWDERKLAKGGYGGLVGVGQGSSRPPRLVKLTYAPARTRGHLSFVGKGITFDTGGISLKPAAGMDQMKSDMAGAAAVMWAVLAAARLTLPVTVTGWLAIAENMPSGTAQRPGDVLTVRGGTTVEVLNTDAEGRLVLADALVDASAEQPDLIVDVATLTGAQRIALGTRVSALMANDEALRARVHAVAESTGEQFWPLPLPPELRASMDSAVADIANIGDGTAGTLAAGIFLSEFIGTRAGSSQKVPWAHLDIASPAMNSKAYGYTPVGATGVAVRTLLALAEDVAAHGA